MKTTKFEFIITVSDQVKKNAIFDDKLNKKNFHTKKTLLDTITLNSRVKLFSITQILKIVAFPWKKKSRFYTILFSYF